MNLHDQMRRLWTDHVVWTRNVIISAIAGLGDLKIVLARLLKNQADIAASIAPYYGTEAANQLHDLLVEHINIAVKLVGALKAGNRTEGEAQNVAWYKNADDISAFLAKANPAWGDMRAMMHEHLALTGAEVVSRLNSDWPADVIAFDKILTQALAMADTLSNGLRSNQ